MIDGPLLAITIPTFIASSLRASTHAVFAWSRLRLFRRCQLPPPIAAILGNVRPFALGEAARQAARVGAAIISRDDEANGVSERQAFRGISTPLLAARWTASMVKPQKAQAHCIAVSRVAG
jgi:hypothetical protein